MEDGGSVPGTGGDSPGLPVWDLGSARSGANNGCGGATATATTGRVGDATEAAEVSRRVEAIFEAGAHTRSQFR
jgi:hypothetical protein